MKLDLQYLHPDELDEETWLEIALLEYKDSRHSPRYKYCFGLYKQWICTRPKNHPGPHIAHGYEISLRLWDQNIAIDYANETGSKLPTPVRTYLGILG
jgi:hypothetical protein